MNAESTEPQDAQMLIFFRSFLRRLIRQGWAKLEAEVHWVINEVKCREDISAPVHDDAGYSQELKRGLCGKVSNCGLKEYVGENIHDFRRVQTALEPRSSEDLS